MQIKELIYLIKQKHSEEGIEIYPAALKSDIQQFEKRIKFTLPDDFREFYSCCNGFGCTEDIFNITPLKDISDYGPNWFYFAEYMINCDMWGLRGTLDGRYEIFNGSYPTLVLTSSLQEFLERFLQGNVFDSGGLYEWQDELQVK